MTVPPNDNATNPTIFLRMKQSDPQPRQIAWNEFSACYSPIIRAFARRLGAQDSDVDDVLQDVLLGFFLKSPTFIYDPAKGRFRGYLKVCTFRALRKRLGQNARVRGQPLDQVDPDAVSIDQIWNDVWEQEQLRRALDDVRRTMGETKTFLAFERYVVFGQPAHEVAEKLEMHINSVYRAKEQVTRGLQERLFALKTED